MTDRWQGMDIRRCSPLQEGNQESNLNIKNYRDYRRYSGIFLILIGIVFLLPRMVNGGDAGPSPMIGLLFIIIGANYLCKGMMGRRDK